MDSHYEKLLQKIIRDDGGGDGFNNHPLDWERFYGFILEVHKGGREKHPSEEEMRSAITPMIPYELGWIEELLTTYYHGINLLDYVAEERNALPRV